MNVFHIHEVVHMVEVISLTMTLGMLIYISVMELIPKVRHTMDKKAAVSGLFVGFLLILIATLI